MRIIHYFLIGCSLSISNTWASTEVLPGLICDTISVSQEENTQLCALNLADHAEWFIFSDTEGNQRLDIMPNSMSIVGDFVVSPARKYLAINSVGEGHPIIDIVELESILDNKEPKVLVSINPYPGVVNLDKWDGEKLLVSCDSLITDKNQSLMTEGKFRVDVATNKITLLSPNPKELLKHFLTFVSGEDKWAALDAINTIQSLKDKKAIPELTNQLKNKKLDAEVKKAIEAAIKALQ